jgi:hypothetical protein
MTAPGGAGDEAAGAEAHRGEGVHGDAVDVLAGGDGLERRPLIDVRANRVLQQDPVHAPVLRQGGDDIDQLGGGGRGG